MKNQRKSSGKKLRAASAARGEKYEAGRLERLRAVVAAAVRQVGKRPSEESIKAFVLASEGFAANWQKRQAGRGHGERAAAVQMDVAAAWRASHAAAFVRAGYVLPSPAQVSPRRGMELKAAAVLGKCCDCLIAIGGGVRVSGTDAGGNARLETWDTLPLAARSLVRGALRAMRPVVRGVGMLPDGAAVLERGQWLEWRRALVRARLEARRLMWAGGGEKAVFASLHDCLALAELFSGHDDTERVVGTVEKRAAAAAGVAVHWGRGDTFKVPRSLGRRVAWASWCLVAFHLAGGTAGKLSREWRGNLRADRARLAVIARIARGEGVQALERVGVAVAAEAEAARDCKAVEKMAATLNKRMAAGDVLITEKFDVVLSAILRGLGWRAVKSFEGQTLIVTQAAAAVVLEAAAAVVAGRAFPVGFAECWQADFEAGLLPVAVRVLGGRVVSRRRRVVAAAVSSIAAGVASSGGMAAAAFRDEMEAIAAAAAEYGRDYLQAAAAIGTAAAVAVSSSKAGKGQGWRAMAAAAGARRVLVESAGDGGAVRAYRVSDHSPIVAGMVQSWARFPALKA